MKGHGIVPAVNERCLYSAQYHLDLSCLCSLHNMREVRLNETRVDATQAVIGPECDDENAHVGRKQWFQAGQATARGITSHAGVYHSPRQVRTVDSCFNSAGKPRATDGDTARLSPSTTTVRLVVAGVPGGFDGPATETVSRAQPSKRAASRQRVWICKLSQRTRWKPTIDYRFQPAMAESNRKDRARE